LTLHIEKPIQITYLSTFGTIAEEGVNLQYESYQVES
jgi:hypothetical protein